MHTIETRAFNLLQLILEGNLYTVDKAMEQFHCTERQISYDIAKINNILSDYKIDPMKISKRKFVISNHTKEAILEINFAGNRLIAGGESRSWLICIMIFCAKEPIGLYNFMGDLKSSKNTVLKDLKILSLTASQYKVKITYSRRLGYHFIGEARSIRTLVLFSISKLKDNYLCKELFGMATGDKEYLSKYKNTATVIKDFVKSYHLPVINDYMIQAVYFISLLPYHRSSFAYSPVIFQEHLWKELPLYNSVKVLQQSLCLQIPIQEIDYLFILILSMTLGYEAYFQVHKREQLFLKTLSKGLVSRFEGAAGTVFQSRLRVEENLVIHLQAAYFRLSCGIPVVNPALEQIKKDYGDVFSICRLVLEPLADYIDCFIPDDEVGYIAMHFLAMMDLEDSELMQKRAVIVCQNGLGSSVMLKNQLTKMFPEIIFLGTYNMEEFKGISVQSYDLIFSTTQIISAEPDKKLFVISPILTLDEKFAVSEQVYASVFGIKSENTINTNSILDIISEYACILDMDGLTLALNNHLNKKYTINRKDGLPVLKDLLTKETIRFKTGAADWRDAIRTSAAPLLENGSIDEHYVTAMIENVEEHGPYIVICPYIAIPHAQNKEGVHKLGMSFLKLEDEVYILNQSDKPVKALITLAAIDNNTHLKALAQLSQLLSEADARERLLACKNCDEVLNIIDTVS